MYHIVPRHDPHYFWTIRRAPSPPFQPRTHMPLQLLIPSGSTNWYGQSGNFAHPSSPGGAALFHRKIRVRADSEIKIPINWVLRPTTAGRCIDESARVCVSISTTWGPHGAGMGVISFGVFHNVVKQSREIKRALACLGIFSPQIPFPDHFSTVGKISKTISQIES